MVKTKPAPRFVADKSTEKSSVYLPLCLVSLVRIGRKPDSLFDGYRKTRLSKTFMRIIAVLAPSRLLSQNYP